MADTSCRGKGCTGGVISKNSQRQSLWQGLGPQGAVRNGQHAKLIADRIGQGASIAFLVASARHDTIDKIERAASGNTVDAAQSGNSA